jgi:outer membrane protein assembly factor BamB
VAIHSTIALAYPEIGFRVARYDAGTHPMEAPVYEPQRVLNVDPSADQMLQGQVWRGNLARTGEFDAIGPQSAPAARWVFDAGGAVKASPVVVDGVVYIGSDAGIFYAIDLASGSELWRFAADAPIRASAAIYAGKVFFGNDRGLFALDATSGEKVWHLTGGKWDDSPLVLPGPVGLRDGTELEGVVFYSEPWRNLVGVDTASGREVWRYRDGKGPGRNGSSALMHEGKIVHFRGSQATEVVDLATERRSYAIDGAIDNAVFTPAARDGFVYSYIYGVVAFDLEANLANAGKGNHRQHFDIKWRYYPEDDPQWDYQHPGISSLSVDQRHVYFGHRDTYVYALDRETGAVAWKTQTGGVNRSSPAIGIGPLLYIGSYNHKVYGLRRLDGVIAWEFATGGPIHSSPVVTGECLLVGSDDGKVYALESR